jgi:predicted nuclease of predicted toxin-antitoxin system
MRLLLDANLSPRLSHNLAEAGYEVVHVADVGLLAATDSEILMWSKEDERVVVTADSDFPMLVALRGASGPSFVLLRGVAELPTQVHADLLVNSLPSVVDDLARGAIVTITPNRLRVRDLPIG